MGIISQAGEIWKFRFGAGLDINGQCIILAGCNTGASLRASAVSKKPFHNANMKLTESGVLDLIRKKTNRPMKISEMSKAFAIPSPSRSEFRKLIRGMAQEGTLIRLKGNRYGLSEEMNLVPGILKGHPDGYAFLIRDKEGSDVFIGRTKMKDAMHGDHVMVRVEAGRDAGKPEGRVVRVLERNTKTLIGMYETFSREGWVVPSDAKIVHEIFVPLKWRGGGRDGQIVSVEIVDYPTSQHAATGRIVEVIGDSSDPRVEVQSLLRKHQVRLAFPEAVQQEAAAIPDSIEEEECQRRMDLRREMVFTIDGEKARDFDDAVSLELMAEGYRLGVHIADVGHYVLEGAPLDDEAFERGTSLYYPDGVVPMLPVELSNDICSLKPGVDRLTLSVFIDFNSEGEVLGSKVCESVINSRFRLTYNQVAKWLDAETVDDEHAALSSALFQMHALSRKLRSRRFYNGSVNFNVPEPVIKIDKDGAVESIAAAEHNDAHHLIEEFMLAANQEVARHLDAKNVPFIHRIHEAPDEEKLTKFNRFVKTFGLRLLHTHKPSSRDLQSLVKRAAGRPEERVVNTLLLRSMKKARYSESDPGHFCLGFEHYAHFTSPIRRYPDLVVHRLVKAYQRKKCSNKERKQLYSTLADIAKQSTDAEVKAVQAEREIISLRQAQFMADKIGSVYPGLINGVTAFGFFVELADILVEGLVHISSLRDDYYVYFEDEHKLQAQHSGKSFSIGESVKVKLTGVDIRKRQIDFSLVQKLPSPSPGK